MYKKIFKYLWLLFVLFSVLPKTCFWTYDEYLDKLRSIDFPVDEYINKESLSRYDMTRLLNLAECFDCNKPADKFKNTLSYSWWQDFILQPWKNFSDILFENTLYNSKDYYYCVSYAGQKWYVNWYPLWTSPFCPWRFCGANNTTNAEFLQVVINILSNYIYSDYEVNWSDAKDWISQQDKDSYQYNYFNLTDLWIINQWEQRCWNSSCRLNSPNEFNTYLKYCTFNLSKCWFEEFDNIKQWTWPVAEYNIMLKEDIISDISTIDLNSPVDGDTVLTYVYRLSQKTYCEFQQDIDTDKDWIIDSLDNCIFTPNPDQLDVDRNWIGDDCEVCDIDKLWIYIISDTIYWQSPFVANFQAFVLWAVSKVQRDFQDWYFAQWIQTTHIFQKPWTYTVIARWFSDDNRVVSSKITVNVYEASSQSNWFGIKAWPIIWVAPFSSLLWWNFDWNISNVQRTILTWTKTIDSWENSFRMIFDKDWTYPILAKAFDKSWNIIWVSQLNLAVWYDNVGSNIRAENLHPNIWETIEIKTFYWWFDETDIYNVVWDFGDGTSISNGELTMSKAYNSWWNKVVKQILTLQDWRKMENALNIYVGSRQKDYWAILSSSSLQQKPWNSITFTLNLKNLKLNEISKIIWDFWNQDKKVFDTDISSSSLFQIYTYNAQWLYTVQATIYLKNSDTLITQLTVYIECQQLCKWSLSKYKCDMDHDGTPDLCDDDIDWDWVKNIIWILISENTDCSIKDTNINKQLLSQEYNLSSKWVYLDNCVFDINRTQEDTDIDWIWDVCDNNSSDKDNDWILDSEDICPTIPENYNWIEDKDWCPEVSYIQTWTSISVCECNSCPCQFVDYQSQLWKNDKIRALLFDKDWNLLYRYSLPKTVNQDIWINN